jgi:phage regulator Rha-like protein
MNNRIGFIGGTDAIQIMNGDWVKLWAIKTGREQPEDLSNNFSVQSGIHNESFILWWFTKQYKQELTDYQKCFEMNWNGVPLKGTIDAATQSGASIVEAKETYEFNKMEDQLDRYMPQLQFYMLISNKDSCYFANKFGNRRWECVHVAKNAEYINTIKSKIFQFWQYVISDSIPPIQDPVEIDTDKVLINQMVKRNGSKNNYFVSLADSYIETVPQAANHEQIKKELKTLIGSNERELYSDKLSLRRDKRGSIRIVIH